MHNFHALESFFILILLKIGIFQNISKNKNISNLEFKFWYNTMFCKELWKWRKLLNTKLVHFTWKGGKRQFYLTQCQMLHSWKRKFDRPTLTSDGPLLNASKWGITLHTIELQLSLNISTPVFGYDYLMKAW